MPSSSIKKGEIVESITATEANQLRAAAATLNLMARMFKSESCVTAAEVVLVEVAKYEKK